ncbi:rod-binding protein [Methylobacterium sp. ID0610]|uniref:rod-binding protein n=1 Tax=Methylobacterium carpenticola TaxID=3344827 RepID=UPI0036AE4E1A
MSIKPPSDIVLDVARAADPTRMQEAAAKLGTTGAPVDPAAFADAMRSVGSSEHMPLDALAALTSAKTDTALSGRKGTGPYRQFEAFVLQHFVESMLPSKAGSVYGKGMAGGYWKSMLAEQIGGQISKAGGIGIARLLASAHPAQTGEAKKVQG